MPIHQVHYSSSFRLCVHLSTSNKYINTFLQVELFNYPMYGRIAGCKDARVILFYCSNAIQWACANY